MGSLENPEAVTIVLEPEAAAVHCRSARLKNTKVLSNISFQDTYETDYCVLNEIGEGNKIMNNVICLKLEFFISLRLISNLLKI